MGESRRSEVRCLGESRPPEVRVLGEFRYVEARGLGESRRFEVRSLGESRPAEVRVLGEGRLAEVCGLGEGRPAEVRVAVELGRRKITFLNREATERIENGSSAEIKLKITPRSCIGVDYLAKSIPTEGTTAFTYFRENEAAYISLVRKYFYV